MDAGKDATANNATAFCTTVASTTRSKILVYFVTTGFGLIDS
jgi:hypothetical protein